MEDRTFRYAIEEQDTPCLCQGSIFQGLGLTAFSPDKLQQPLSDELLKFRIGKRDSADLQWEGQCSVREAKICDIIAWNSIKDCNHVSETEKSIQQKLDACCNKHFWLYADYMYMKDVFKNQPDVLKSLDWDSLGFSGKSGADSTMWFGTAGAYTLCHYDTYGFNIVVQVSGSKRWTLFPPSDTKYLYPTRIPYEESSVFSEVNINNPDLGKHPEFLSATRYVVTLMAGDVLYVPHHWWHFVENLEMSVSINLWYEMVSDSKSRLDESITRLLIGTCSHVPTSQRISWLNPNEDLDSIVSTDECMQYLNQSIREAENTRFKKKDTEYRTIPIPSKSESQDHLFKIIPLSPTNCLEVIKAKKRHVTHGSEKNPVKKAKIMQQTEFGEQAQCPVTFTDFVHCLTHPDVIATIADVINMRFNHKKEYDS